MIDTLCFASNLLMPAIYYSYINATQLERGMIEKCLEREKVMEVLKSLIVKMDLDQDDPTEEQLFQSIKYFILLRNSTVALLKAIQEWQQTFTNLKRPQLMEKDYLVGMISDSDYFSNSKARKYLNFMIGRGNPLLLPRSMAVNAGKSTPPKMVSRKLADLIFKYVNADQDDIRNSYQVFVDSLSPFQYKKLYSANAWLTGEAWMPYIDVKGVPRTSASVTPISKRNTLSAVEIDKASTIQQDRRSTVASIQKDSSAKEEFTLIRDSSEAEPTKKEDDVVSLDVDVDKKGNNTMTSSDVRGRTESPRVSFTSTSGDLEESQPTLSVNGPIVNAKADPSTNAKRSVSPSKEKNNNKFVSKKSGNMKVVNEEVLKEQEKPMREKKVSTKAATHVARYQDDTLLSLDERVAKMKVSTGALKQWFESDMKETFLASPANGRNKLKSPTAPKSRKVDSRL